MENYSEFYQFMIEYTELFEEVKEKQEQKMKALYSRDLKKLDEILTEHQETEKKIEDYETRRIQLHKKLGLESKTFKEIIGMSGENERTELTKLFERLKSAVYCAKDFNKRSLDFAQMNLEIVESINSKSVDNPQCYDKSGITNNSAKGSVLLNAKI